ncbi:sensor histidine kinase [Amycolatopsis nalaikhensis]|uniref:histidine kinase n=1 Tax=Amycolatopsis nalaikhensis TaxID=715472 RepID=A0ABY8XHX2_9PSEU|nr:histidine kinase [Amycolatopsis sp. 2-2]WIV55221.1 histidine kinase [Amycolatopsis sp. 2-2]
MRARVVSGVRTRLEASLGRAGIALPWWIPVGATAVGVLLVVVSAAQRGPTLLSVVAGLLALATQLGWALTGAIAPSWLKTLTVLGAVGLLLSDPVVPDFSPVLLVVLAAETALINRPGFAFAATAASLATLGVAAAWVGLVGFPVYSAAVLLGLSGGLMGRWYGRALDAERAARDAVRDQAVLAERQRIAREVHDVVAHSLSITLLHLTGTRHALRQDRDIDEALDGLEEAERVGRTAMADIRRTVGLLAEAPAGTRPLPDARDISALVERTRAAGLDVRYEQEGDLAEVPDLAGLGLYRIAQESLANVAKHGGGAPARMRLAVGPAGARLTVRNRLPAGAVPAEGGSGVTGMAARAGQLGAELSAGPEGADWVVAVSVPAGVRPVAP